jgi:hypothetical protein
MPTKSRSAPRTLSATLRRGGFLVEQTFDELGAIRERYREARGRTPMVLTLTTTQDCNLGCYYCYGPCNQTFSTSCIQALARRIRSVPILVACSATPWCWACGLP